MAKFVDNAEAVIKTAELKSHPSDKLSRVLKKEAEQNVKDKFYIKRNMKTVIKMDRDMK